MPRERRWLTLSTHATRADASAEAARWRAQALRVAADLTAERARLTAIDGRDRPAVPATRYQVSALHGTYRVQRQNT